MVRIAILTLTEQRDKAVDERLAQLLRDEGHEVMVRHFAMAGQECVCYEKPEVVVVPMVGSLQKLDFVKHCHDWGLTVVVRRGEAAQPARSWSRWTRSDRRSSWATTTTPLTWTWN